MPYCLSACLFLSVISHTNRDEEVSLSFRSDLKLLRHSLLEVADLSSPRTDLVLLIIQACCYGSFGNALPQQLLLSQDRRAFVLLVES